MAGLILDAMGTAIVLLLVTVSAAAERLNGFDLSGALVPREAVQRGGPPRDGIPALTDPKFVPAERSGLGSQDRVVGLKLGGAAKAYPIRILNWHEVVNDAVAGRRVVVTYCPLCGTAMVFDAEAGGLRRTFGVSGLLYDSDVLLYDKEAGSLWSQLMRKAVAGPAKGAELTQVAARHTTWGEWLRENPETAVLSFETGFARDYSRDPYAGYGSQEAVLFPVRHSDGRLGAKEWVLGLVLAGTAKAYPLKGCPGKEFADRLAGQTVSIHCDPGARSAFVLDEHGLELPSTQAYWFAWSAFHPETELYGGPR